MSIELSILSNHKTFGVFLVHTYKYIWFHLCFIKGDISYVRGFLYLIESSLLWFGFSEFGSIIDQRGQTCPGLCSFAVIIN